MKFCLWVFIICIACSSFAQKEQAQSYVNTLASAEFQGRGYVKNGDKIASDYIKKQFETFGLRAFKSGYFQNFTLDVNTFPDSVVLRIDGKTLKTGYDFIIDPYSGSSKGHYTPIWITIEDLDNLPSIVTQASMVNPIFIIDPTGTSNQDTLVEFRSLKYALAKQAPVIWVNNDKYTWSVAKEHLPFPIFEVGDSLISSAQKIDINVHQKLIKNYPSRNVIGYLPAKKGSGCKPYKVITAHYDHLGRMGNTAYIPGANDNASGVAMLLTLAKHYAENPPKDFNIVFIAFGGEEAGLVGSKYYTEHPVFKLKKIDFLLNLDLQGTGSEGITVVNAALHPQAFQTLVEINKENSYLAKVKKRGEAANSDHYYFTKKGVPAFFIYTMGGISAYHDVHDKAETLPLTEFNDLFQLYLKFLAKV